MHIPPTPEPPRKRHRLRNGLLSAAAVLVALGVISALTSNTGQPRPAPSPSPSFSPYSEQFQPSSPPLSAGEVKFVAAIRSAFSAAGQYSYTTSDQFASVGTQICKVREGGNSQAAAVSAIPADAKAKFGMSASKLVKTAERDICPSQYQAPQTVTYIVTGSPADVTYGPAGSDLNGSVPMHLTEPLGDPSYYAINAQLQGDGTVTCEIEVDGQVIATGTGQGSYNIADCEIGQNPVSGQWESDNS